MKPGFRYLIEASNTGLVDPADRPIWELKQPLFFYSAAFGCWLMVPRGFRTNYSSVPRLPIVYWWYANRCWEEPALHDFAYTAHGIWVVCLSQESGQWASPLFMPLSRKEADALLLEALLANPRTSDCMDRVMYAGVRLGGGSSWEDTTCVHQTVNFRELASLT